MDKKIQVARCHEILLTTRDREISRFEAIPEIGMAVQLALHIRGLALIDFERLKIVASALLGIPRLAVERIVRLLEEVGFVQVQSTGATIKAIVPTVPFYDGLYEGIGEYMATVRKPDEFELLTLTMVDVLAAAPANKDSLRSKLNADKKAFKDAVTIGSRGSFILSRRARGKDILINPTYYGENADLFADHVASTGADSVAHLMGLLRTAQGWPLKLVEEQQEILGVKVDSHSIALLKKLAQEGIVRPPSISTSYSGDNFFLFTPSPGRAKVSPLKRDVYERAMAVVAAVRQGQLLPNRFAIRSPGAVLYRLKTDHRLKPTTDYGQQYKNLVHMRIANLVRVAGGYQQLELVDTPENREALQVAYDLVTSGSSTGLSVDTDATMALEGDETYLESLLSTRVLRERETIALPEDKQFELEQLTLEGI